MANSWRIDLFGSLIVRKQEVRITHFRTSRSAVLLAYLACQPGMAFSRDSLGELLWPDEDPCKQRDRLRHEISLLRKQLGNSIFETSGRLKIALAPGHTSDIAEFDVALRSAAHTSGSLRISALQSALELYQGDFLCELWDEWIIAIG